MHSINCEWTINLEEVAKHYPSIKEKLEKFNKLLKESDFLPDEGNVSDFFLTDEEYELAEAFSELYDEVYKHTDLKIALHYHNPENGTHYDDISGYFWVVEEGLYEFNSDVPIIVMNFVNKKGYIIEE